MDDRELDIAYVESVVENERLEREWRQSKRGQRARIENGENIGWGEQEGEGAGATAGEGTTAEEGT